MLQVGYLHHFFPGAPMLQTKIYLCCSPSSISSHIAHAARAWLLTVISSTARIIRVFHADKHKRYFTVHVTLGTFELHFLKRFLLLASASWQSSVFLLFTYPAFLVTLFLVSLIDSLCPIIKQPFNTGAFLRFSAGVPSLLSLPPHYWPQFRVWGRPIHIPHQPLRSRLLLSAASGHQYRLKLSTSEPRIMVIFLTHYPLAF